MDAYNAARKAFPAPLDQAAFPENYKVIQNPERIPVLRDGSTSGIFWDRKLKNFNPLRLFSSETCDRFTALRYNYCQYHLLRPKGILSTALVYGGSGWVAAVMYKNRYHYEYKYH